MRARNSDAAETTQVTIGDTISKSLYAVLFTICLLSTPYRFLWSLSISPFLALCISGLKTSRLAGLLLAVVWTVYLLLAFLPLYWLIGRFFILSIYSPIYIIYGKALHQLPGLAYLILQTVVWDWPLLLWVHIASVLSIRALSPFCSEIDDYLCVGSVPLPSDIKYLNNCGVGAVVNMCREYAGPLNEYEKCGIEQIHLPTPDISEPSFTDIIKGVNFMSSFKLRNPNKKVFVHCKGIILE